MVNERRRYYITPSLIGRVHTQNDPCPSVYNSHFHFVFSGGQCWLPCRQIRGCSTWLQLWHRGRCGGHLWTQPHWWDPQHVDCQLSAGWRLRVPAVWHSSAAQAAGSFHCEGRLDHVHHLPQRIQSHHRIHLPGKFGMDREPFSDTVNSVYLRFKFHLNFILPVWIQLTVTQHYFR